MPGGGPCDPGAGSGTNVPGDIPDVEGLELAIGDYYLCGWLNGGAYGIEGDAPFRETVIEDAFDAIFIASFIV